MFGWCQVQRLDCPPLMPASRGGGRDDNIKADRSRTAVRRAREEPPFLLQRLRAADNQWTFSELSVNIQWTFSEHSVNFQWTFSEQSDNIKADRSRAAVRRAREEPPFLLQRLRAADNQWTFSEHSVNIHSNIQSTFSEHSVNIQRTFSEHSENI
jgi:hypothetical protein